MSAISWFWDGEALRPARKFISRAATEFALDQRYVLEAVEQEQSERDKAYHATLREAWINLPEHLAEQFPNPTDFRRWLLVECGFCDVAKLAFATSRAAKAALPFLQSEGAQLSVVGSVVVVKKPWSQKLRGGMDKANRLRSYEDTQAMAAEMIGVTVDELGKAEAT